MSIRFPSGTSLLEGDLDGLKNLQALNLGGERVSRLHGAYSAPWAISSNALGGLSNLRSLYLYGGGSTPRFNDLRNLETLELNGRWELGSDGFIGLNNLQSLSLVGEIENRGSWWGGDSGGGVSSSHCTDHGLNMLMVDSFRDLTRLKTLTLCDDPRDDLTYPSISPALVAELDELEESNVRLDFVLSCRQISVGGESGVVCGVLPSAQDRFRHLLP